jgi:hypothetical protein
MDCQIALLPINEDGSDLPRNPDSIFSPKPIGFSSRMLVLRHGKESELTNRETRVFSAKDPLGSILSRNPDSPSL